MADNAFTQVMQQRSDAELIEIVTKLRNDYQPDAVATAETELKNRNLATDKIDLAKKEIAQKHKAIEKKANKPLGFGLKLLCFFFPIISYLFIAYLSEVRGYELKSKEAVAWNVLGIAFYILLRIIIEL